MARVDVPPPGIAADALQNVPIISLSSNLAADAPAAHVSDDYR